jgi:hypothetical protein
MMEATVFLGSFNAAVIFWYSSTHLFLDTILSRNSTDNSVDLMVWFLLWHALSAVVPYIDGCVHLSKSCPINWIYHTGCTGAQFESHSKGSEYLCKKRYFCLFYFKYFLKPVFILSLLCVDWCGHKNKAVMWKKWRRLNIFRMHRMQAQTYLLLITNTGKNMHTQKHRSIHIYTHAHTHSSYKSAGAYRCNEIKGRQWAPYSLSTAFCSLINKDGESNQRTDTLTCSSLLY